MTTEHLLTGDGGIQATVGEEGLGNRGQQRHAIFRFFLGVCVFAELGGIQLHAHVGGQCTAPFVDGTHVHQHAAHITVHDDRIRWPFRVFRAGGTAALQTFAGVFHRALVAGFTQAQALQTDRQTLVVHHGEHARQPLVRLTDDPAFGIVEIHHASG